MDRLNRLIGRLPSYFRRKSVEYRKDYKEMTYDIKRVQKGTLLNIYNTTVTLATIGTSGAYLVYNTYCKDKLTERTLLKVGEKLIPLNEDLELLAIREWSFAHVSRSYKLLDLLKFYSCKGPDIISYGDLMTRTGVDIGLPHNFTYKTVADVKLSEVTLSGQSLKESEKSVSENAMNKLIQSLVLSEKAKRFAITREIHFTDRYRIFAEAVNIMVSTMAAVGVGQQIILTMNLRRKYLLSFLFRCSSLVLGLGVWFLIRQSYTRGWNIEADQRAVEQGNDYYDGAIEYYTKLLQRNSALYELLGPKGQKRYTKDGEPKGLFTSVPSFENRLKMIRELEPQTEETDTETKLLNEEIEE